MAIHTVITSITYRRKVNTGNFESFDVEATCACGERDAYEHAGYLRSFVDTICLEKLAAIRRGALDTHDASDELPI